MKKINNEIFIEKANLKHKNKYNYSSVNYINCKIKINIICLQHGVFKQTPDSHLSGHGCPICAINNNKIKFLKLREDFIKKSLIVHKSKYDYSLCIYEGTFKKIEIICKKHGVFKQTPDSHLRGRGCPKCVNRATTILEFIDRANIVHNYTYNYENSIYINPTTKIDIICKKHGLFKQTPNSHLNGSGCPICKLSKGENKINNFLKLNNISFINQKKFKDCKNIYPLPFDFYLPDYNLLIEYDGDHHIKPVNFFGISNDKALIGFNNTIKNDLIKDEYAINNGINLIRLSIVDFKDIDNKLKNILNLK